MPFVSTEYSHRRMEMNLPLIIFLRRSSNVHRNEKQLAASLVYSKFRSTKRPQRCVINHIARDQALVRPSLIMSSQPLFFSPCQAEYYITDSRVCSHSRCLSIMSPIFNEYFTNRYTKKLLPRKLACHLAFKKEKSMRRSRRNEKDDCRAKLLSASSGTTVFIFPM